MSGAQNHAAIDQHRAADEVTGDRFGNRRGLAGDHRFVNVACAFNDDSVNRNNLTDTHAHVITNDQ